MEYGTCAMTGSSRYISPSERVHGVHTDIKHLNRADQYKKECGVCHARVQQVHFSFREGSWSTVHAPCQGPAGRGVHGVHCARSGSSRYFSPSERVHGVRYICQGSAGTFLLQRGFWSTFAPCQGSAGTFLLQSGVMEYICAMVGFSRYFSPSERVLEYFCAMPGSSRYVSPSERGHGVRYMRHARVQQVEGFMEYIYAMPESSR
jgi:hypothetical protein